MKDYLKISNLIRFIIIGVLFLFCAGMEYYFHIVRGISIVYTHLYYIPIALAAFWWGLKVVFPVSLILGFLHIICDFPGITEEVLIRAIVFIFIGFIMGVMRNRNKRDEKKIIHLNSVLRSIRNVNQLIVREKDTDKLLKGICDTLVKTRGYSSAWIALLDESGVLLKIAETGIGEDFSPMVRLMESGKLPGCGNRAMSQSGIVVIEDPVSECTDCPIADKYRDNGILTFRLEYSGKVYGLMAVSTSKEFLNNEVEQSLFIEVSGDIAFALHNFELEEERYLQETRKRALQKVRDNIWNMQKEEDIKKVISAVYESLEELQVPFRNCGINVVDTSTEPPEVKSYNIINKKLIRSSIIEKERVVILNIWRKGVTDYRRDIKKSDNHGEGEYIEKRHEHTVRSVIDVPFSHGSLAINNPEPDAFSERDISILQDMAQVVTEGFKRTEDLRNLEKYTKELESEIAERKKGAEALRESEEKYRSVFENTGTATTIVEENTTISMVNEKFEKLSGYTREEIEGKMSWTYFVVKDDLERMKKHHYERREKGVKAPHQYEFRFIDKNKNIKDIFLVIDLISGTKKSVASLLDITERKKADEQIHKNLKEKEILLNEIHHRVKNNMQVISSLLSHQAERIENKKYRDIYYESINRVKTMAVIHEMFYQSEDLSRINFGDYIDRICENLTGLYMTDTEKIEINTYIRNIYLSMDTAIPCGLIVNELISNSLKHGFPDNRKGKITITMKKVKDKKIELKICDNGIGIPQTFDWENTDSLGLHLVNLLAEVQLEGTIELTRTEGTEFRIIF